ncbi:MAG TPA: MBL fold metallo-hydrolase [Methanospirillum sp.]|nr:MBL fold metallo-hydrolase [Methanospirillum sp.]
MIIKNLTVGRTEYTSSVWHATGEYRALSDVNTLIDVGYDPVVLSNLNKIIPGIGKNIIDQIFLTHSHFDHTYNISSVLEKYPVPVYAHPKNNTPGIIPVVDRMNVMIADQEGEIIYTPGHSEDSICILCPEEGILFSGDMPYRIFSDSDEYHSDFIDALNYICSYDIQVIYSGHGDPITEYAQRLLNDSLQTIKQSRR